MRDLANGVALVTGGAHRVGRALVEALAHAGMRVAIHYNAASAEADRLVAELTATGHSAAAFGADLRDANAPSTLVDAVVDELGALDLLVNSAAVMRRTPVDTVTVAEWDDMFALNLRAPFFLAQAAAPALRRTRGSIINMADLAAFETWPAYIPHTITKAAVVQMTRGLARAFAPDIRVNAIAPGAVLLPEDWDEASRDHLIETTPLRRIGSPADVAEAALYLARADYVTGEVLIVDGGRHVRS